MQRIDDVDGEAARLLHRACRDKFPELTDPFANMEPGTQTGRERIPIEEALKPAE